jgi:hypothetical protein
MRTQLYCLTLYVQYMLRYIDEGPPFKRNRHNWWIGMLLLGLLYSSLLTIILRNCPVGIKNLKGQSHEFFDPLFFSQSIPTRTLIHRLKPFSISLRIRRANRFESPSSSYYLHFLVTMCMWCLPTVFICFCHGFPRKGMRAINRFRKDSRGVIRFPQSHWDQGIRFRGLIETEGSDPMVSLKPGKLILRSYWDRRIWTLRSNTLANT